MKSRYFINSILLSFLILFPFYSFASVQQDNFLKYIKDHGYSTWSVNPIYSSDGLSYAFIWKYYMKNILIKDWVVIDEYDSVASPMYSPDWKSFVFSAWKYDRMFLVKDWVSLDKYPTTRYPIFSLDSKSFSFLAWKSQKNIVVKDGEEIDKFENASYPLYLNDWTLCFLWYKDRSFFIYKQIWTWVSTEFFPVNSSFADLRLYSDWIYISVYDKKTNKIVYTDKVWSSVIETSTWTSDQAQTVVVSDKFPLKNYTVWTLIYRLVKLAEIRANWDISQKNNLLSIVKERLEWLIVSQKLWENATLQAKLLIEYLSR